MKTMNVESRMISKMSEVLEPELSEWDQKAFERLISIQLSEEQIAAITSPPTMYPKVKQVLAVHWHPEFIPFEFIRTRIQKTFPSMEESLIIPTQHNMLLTWDEYSGAEVDCYAKSFNRKVQLLIHFRKEKVEDASVLQQMLKHTHRYRSRQLFSFIDAVLNPNRISWLEKAARDTGADEELMQFTRLFVGKLQKLLEKNESITPPDAIKNKLIRNYFDLLREHFDDQLINHAQVFLKTIKGIVKSNFALEYFYEVNEIIEEVRSLGGGIIIPHPEQFWPILLAGYDVDGIEVWNPQSHEFTEFLISAVNEQNKSKKADLKPLLIFMGDDTHLGEKVKPKEQQDTEKAGREIGVQPAWSDLSIQKSLIIGNCNKLRVMNEYKHRLG